MEIITYSHTPAKFLQAARSILEPEEAANNLIIGLADRMTRNPSQEATSNVLGIAYLSAQPVVAFLRTPGRNLILHTSDDAWQPHLPELVSYIRQVCPDIPGVHARTQQAKAFAAAWGTAYAITTHQGVYRLDQVRAPRPALGRLRRPTLEDLPIITQWLGAFYQEAMQKMLPDDQVFQQCETFIANNTLWVWDQDGPVSMTVVHRPTWNGCCLSYVYTPPALRRNGYASNLVADLSQELLDSGKQFCALFTDLANPTSNKIYQALGYRQVATFAEVSFEQ